MSVEPYYSDDHCTIYHGDCLEILPTLSDVGLVLTSPPYNLREGGRDPSGGGWQRLGTRKPEDGYASYSDDLPHDDYVSWQRSVLRFCWSALTPDGAIYYQHKPINRDGVCRLPFEQIPPEATLRQVVTWDRRAGFAQSFWYYTPRFEWVLVLAKQGFRINRLGVPDVWEIPPVADKQHPASYPIKLATLAIGTTDAELVLDPFMGSGTTLRAAKDLGRKAIGIEIEERYCEIAAKRLGQEVLF